ncbi:MAG TPA: TspO/MBR family protein [Reyranella sp.]|nr:translocator protein [Rhodospirillaceae bacterium]MEA2806262.1 translocator protein [Rhodospirillaceae bacterium]MEA2849830.1 translocator protein [Rhodospirillaceae bacterium]
MPVRSRLADIVALVLFVALCLGIGALGASVTATSVDTWYAGLVKPSFNPPDEVFGPVWTVLYILMGVAAWRVWRSADRDTTRGPLTLFALQLAINLGWTVVFFGLHKIASAVATIVVLDVAVLVTMLAFRSVDRLAALLMLPYVAWVAFATVLNVAIWRLNPAV